jgi:hypothetical protein
MTNRSKVGWHPVATPNNSACAPLPGEAFGAVVNGGRPNATAASPRNDDSVTSIAATRRPNFRFRGVITLSGLDHLAAPVKLQQFGPASASDYRFSSNATVRAGRLGASARASMDTGRRGSPASSRGSCQQRGSTTGQLRRCRIFRTQRRTRTRRGTVGVRQVGVRGPSGDRLAQLSQDAGTRSPVHARKSSAARPSAETWCADSSARAQPWLWLTTSTLCPSGSSTNAP